jgi:hypothetical protein
MPRVRIEDFEDENLDRIPNMERFKKRPKEEQKPAKEKTKKPKREKPQLEEDLIYFSRNPK